MRHFWDGEFPVGDPFRGAPYGERTDPASIGGAGAGAAGGMSSGAGMLGMASMFLNFTGNMGAASASRDAGRAAKAAADFEAAQLSQAAGQAQAASQRDAARERKRAEILISRGLAVAAASGGGASDATVVDLLADIEGEGAYRAGVALYQGDEKARQLRMGADAKRYEGEVAEQGGRDRARAYTIAGFGGLAANGASFYGKYGKGGPKARGGALSGGGSWVDAGTSGYPTIG